MSNLIKIIHSVSNKLTDVNDELEIYQIMNDAIKEILPDSYFLITKLQPDDMNFRIIHSFGLDKYLTTIKTLVGKDPFEIDFPFSDLSEAEQEEFQNRELHHFPEGLYDAVNGRINKTVCKTIEKILGVSEVYAISFCISKNYFGGATFFIPKSYESQSCSSKNCKLAIESLASQASFAINKLRDFEAITKKENELAIAHSKFNQLVNQLNDIVWVAKGDGTEIIDLNDSFMKYFGYPSSDFAKNPDMWLDIVYEDDKKIAIQSNKELIINGNAECEYRIIKADGTIMWLHERKSIVYDKIGKPFQMGGVASDITEKKMLEEQLRLKDYALENSPNAIAFTDLNGYITYSNNGYLKLFGYDDKKEIIGKHISKFASENDYDKTILDKIKKGDVYIGEIKPKKMDGTIFNSIVLASPVIHEKKTLCIMAAFIDISELKKLEANLKESEASLLKQNNDKDKFFAIIAHDLKSPFNGLLGLLDILHNNYSNYSDSQRRKMIEASLQASQKIFVLLLDLLEWARLQNNHLEINKKTDYLDLIIKKNINLYLNDAELKGISIKNKIKLSPLLNIDLNSINSVIRNLLVNAIKFTPNGGCIEFDLNEINDTIELSIKDTGIGMSEDTIDKLFKLDESLSMPGTNNEKGTGLGLLICKGIVAKNNWQMNVESQLGNGSTFKVLIPED
ncbi:sensor histidine kinase [Lutibacter citreus]|uniref:sensor histidine kinase n=1 Tax=Lutibacter citreus TaxID=2138210 RepID=UPI000DBE0017|nr:PAS domain-containing sensor histidine kinase [Lutibacter citreus]